MGKIAKTKKEDPGRIGVGKFWAWQSRGISLAANVMVLGYLNMYCTNALGMNPATVGVLLLASKIFDGVTDLFAGYLVDNTETRWGKARPYELAILGVWICTILMFHCPPAASTAVKCVWIFSLYTLTNSVFATLLNVAGGPYTLRAFKNQEQINKIASLGGVAIMLVCIIVSVSLPIAIARIAISPAGWGRVAMLYGVPLAVIGILRFLFVPETVKIEDETKDKVKFSELFVMLKTNKYIYPVIIANLIFQLVLGMNVASYYFLYIVGDLEKQSVFGFLSVIVLPVMLTFPALMKKMPVSRIIMLGAFVGSAGSLLNFFAGANMGLLIVGGILSSMATLAPSYLLLLMLFECGTYNSLMGQARMDGTINALNNFTAKLGTGIGSGLIGIILGAVGFDGMAAVQTSLVNFTIRGIYGLIPCVGYAILGFIMMGYKLTKVLAEMQEKRAAEEA